MKPFVFLGGTVGNSTWREPFTQGLVKLGLTPERIFNPVVADWTAECQTREDAAKREAEYVLFYICDPRQPGNQVSGYSLVEATMALYDQPKSAVAVFDLEGIDGHSLKALQKTEQDLRARFPEGHIFSNASDALEFFASETAGGRVKSGAGGN